MPSRRAVQHKSGGKKKGESMKISEAAISVALGALLTVGVGVAHTKSISGRNIRLAVAGADDAATPVHTSHQYSPYEQLVFKNVSQFHKNFNARQFEKNGDLVADDLRVNSNGTELHGREAFVSRIGRFVEPFPDVKLDDQIILVDGNMAAIRFVITGTQKGDLKTPEGVIHATNRPIHVDGTEFFTFNKEGKLTDLVTVENFTQLFQQLKATN
jgi:predicted ester cyclase